MQSMQNMQIMQKNESYEPTYTHTQAVLVNKIFNLAVGSQPFQKNCIIYTVSFGAHSHSLHCGEKSNHNI